MAEGTLRVTNSKSLTCVMTISGDYWLTCWEIYHIEIYIYHAFRKPSDLEQMGYLRGFKVENCE